MEHILELLSSHGFDDVIVTLAFLPQAIRSYFGDGESLGLSIEYSVEESPLGTAGSVRLASGRLDDTVLVISGDALCDIDLSKLVAFHREREAAVTIGLKAVENPLEFGIVVTDEDGRIERFLEKPSWGQVFSDTINTGIYVLEPEVLAARPHRSTVRLLEGALPAPPGDGPAAVRRWSATATGRTSATSTSSARRTSTRSTGRSRWTFPGIRLRGNIWIGEGVEIDDLEARRRAGVHRQLLPDLAAGRRSGRTRCSPRASPCGKRARTVRSVIDASTHVGRSALVEGAMLGRNCDVRAHVRIQEGAAIGDEVVLGVAEHDPARASGSTRTRRSSPARTSTRA